MSKTVGTILTVASVAFAIAVPIIGPTAMLATFGLTATASAAIAAGMSVAIMVNALLMPKGSGERMPERQAAQVALQMGEVPRSAIFGEAVTGGSLVDAFNYGGQYGTDWEVLILAIADHKCEGLTGFYVNDTFVSYAADGVVPGYNGQLKVYWRDGSAGQTVPAVVLNNGPGWTASDVGTGVAWVAVEYKADKPDAENPVWPGGRPRFLWRVKGKRCYDSRKDSTVPGGSGLHRWADPATWEYSNNPIVCRYNWARGVYAKDQVGSPEMLLVGRGLSAVEQPPANLFAPANLCDELVGGERQFQIGGAVYANETFLDVEERFAAAVAGIIITREGAVEIEPAQAKAIAATFTDDDLLVGGEVRYNESILSEADRQWVNTVIPRYVEPNQKWRDHAAPVRRDVADLVADGGPREETIALDMVTRGVQAGVTGEIHRRLGRLWARGSVPLPPRFAQLEEGDWVNWTSVRRFGGLTRTFRIEAFGLDEKWQSRHQLREIGASVFTGVPGLADQASAHAPGTTPSLVAPPADFTLTATSVTVLGGPAAALQLAGAVTILACEAVWVEYRAYVAGQAADANWASAGIESRSATNKLITNVRGDTAYEASIRYRISGEWSPRLILGPVTTSASAVPWTGIDGRPANLAALTGAELIENQALLDSIANDQILSVTEKRMVLARLIAEMAARDEAVKTRADAAGLSTAALVAQRDNWEALIASYTPAANDYSADTRIYTPLLAQDFPTGWTAIGGLTQAANGVYRTLTDPSATAYSRLNSAPAAVGAAQVFSFALAIRKETAGTNWGLLRLVYSGGAYGEFVFNPRTGQLVSGTGITGGVESLDLGSDWLARGTVTTPAGTTSVRLEIYPAIAQGTSYTAFDPAATGSINVLGQPLVAAGDFKALGWHQLTGRLNAYSAEIIALAARLADWPSVTGPGKPADNATVGATQGRDLRNAVNQLYSQEDLENASLAIEADTLGTGSRARLRLKRGGTYNTTIEFPATVQNKDQLFAEVGGADKPEANATKSRVFRQATAPMAPTVNDVWVDTSLTPNVTNVWDGAAWQSAANLIASADHVPESAGRKWAGESGADVTSGKPLSSLIGRTADQISYTAGGTVDSLKPAEAGAEATTGKSVDILADGTTYARLPVANTTGTGTARRAIVDLAQAHVNKNLANVDSTANNKLGGIEAGATVGSRVGTNTKAADGVTVLGATDLQNDQLTLAYQRTGETERVLLKRGGTTNTELNLGNLYNVGQPNLLFNGSFRLTDSAGKPLGWVLDAGWNWVAGNNEGPFMHAPVGGTIVGASEPVVVAAGQSYSLQGELFAEGVTAGSLNADVQWYSDAAATVLVLDDGEITAVNGASWAKRTKLNYVAPTGAIRARVRFFLAAATNTSAAVRRLKFSGGASESPFSDEKTNDAELLTRAGTGRRVGDQRNLPAITAMNLGYQFTGSISYTASAGSPATATISVTAGSCLIGSVSVAYNAMSVNTTGTGGTSVTYQLYVDDPAYSGGARTLVATTVSNDLFAADGRVRIGQVTVAYPTSGTTSPTPGTSGGGGGGALP